ncbi:hypothetical protein AYO47_00720 [Planctomyces sp. SCGC AG-212-M04]|nr:hypothetical protein AYO47_00720 [Planctomyces sp. SCGC AG-212-M04]
MALSRRRTTLITAITVCILAIAAYAFLTRWVSLTIVTVHQRSTMHELASWEREFSLISTAKDAERASEILEYARTYYVVGPGYRSDTETERNLETQRRRTIDSIDAALKEYKRRKPGEAPAEEGLAK